MFLKFFNYVCIALTFCKMLISKLESDSVFMKKGYRHRSLLFFWILLFFLSYNLSAQTPWAEVISNDTTVCEIDTAFLSVKFTGDQPFGFSFQTKRYFADGTLTDETEIERGPIYNDYWTKSFPNLNGLDSLIIIITEVFDNTVPLPWNIGSGVPVTGERMKVIVDSVPAPSAGNDISSLCGYTATLDASPEIATSTYYWSESPHGTFTDPNDPKTDFEANTEGTFTLWFVEVNGACTDSASVDVELLGTPKAKISGSSTICSTDNNPDEIRITVDYLSNSSPYSYTVSDGTIEFSKTGLTTPVDVTTVSATGDQVFKITSFSDTRNGKECYAREEDISGEAVVDDVKPAAFPGNDKVVCGETKTKLEATLENTGNTGLWSATDVTFGNVTDPNTTATITNHGFYTLTWTETEPVLGCKNSNDVTINFAEAPGLTYSKDTTICNGSTATLHLNATGNSPWTLTYTIDETSSDLVLNSPFETKDFKPTENTTVVLDSIVGTYGCVTQINGSYKITVDEMPQAFAGIYDPVCSDQIQLQAVPSIINSKGEWNGTGTFEDITSPTTLFTAAGYGEQMLTWTEWNIKNKNCIDISAVTIRFDKTPKPPYAGNDKTLYLEYSTTLDADPALPGEGTWSASNSEITFDDPHNPNATVENLKMGSQTLTWTVVNGVCAAESDDVDIEVKGLTNPNGFSPNGDGVNDYFKIMGADQIQDNELKVFDVNGKLVFQTKNYRNDWNGKNMDGEPLDDGTYYYVFTGKNIDPIKEFLIIKRSKNNR